MSTNHSAVRIGSPLGYRKDGRAIYSVSGGQPTLIEQLSEKRGKLQTELDGIVTGAESRGADAGLTDEERARFREITEALEPIDERLAELGTAQRKKNAAAAVVREFLPQGGATIGKEPRVYERGNGNSYFGDMIRAEKRQDPAARERLIRYMQEQVVEREAEGRAMSRVVGAGGTFVPPVYLIEDYIGPLRPGRVTADLCNRQPLPPGTDSINLPKITTGALTGIQSADNNAVAAQDMTDAYVSAPVNTIAGQSDVSMQLIDQSPINMDEVIMADLANDYNRRLDLQIINGSGTGGQHQGILTLAGINAITYTQATPAVGGKGGLYSNIAQAIGTVAGSRFMPATAIVMTPLRWAWVLAASDSSNRPLVSPQGSQSFNGIGAGSVGDPAQGSVGTMGGLPVFVDANLPTNLGAGTNQDPVLVCKWDDLYLYEGAVNTRMLDQILSGTLGVRIQLYAYSAFLPGRYPVSVGSVNGTGLVTPGF